MDKEIVITSSGVDDEYTLLGIVPCDGIFKGFLPDGTMLLEAIDKQLES